jgi:hypothetical protein
MNDDSLALLTHVLGNNDRPVGKWTKDEYGTLKIAFFIIMAGSMLPIIALVVYGTIKAYA